MTSLKRVFLVSLLFISIFILSGCGETKEDKKHANNPEQYLKETLKERYDIDFEIEKQETKFYDRERKKGKHEFFTLSLKDDKNFKFNATTFWNTADEEIVSRYKLATNYESYINNDLLEKYFLDYSKIKFISELDKVSEENYLTNYIFSIYIEDTKYIDELPKVLINLQNNVKGLYPLNLFVKSNGKVVKVALKPRNNSVTIDEIKKKIMNLK